MRMLCVVAMLALAAPAFARQTFTGWVCTTDIDAAELAERLTEKQPRESDEFVVNALNKERRAAACGRYVNADFTPGQEKVMRAPRGALVKLYELHIGPNETWWYGTTNGVFQTVGQEQDI